MFKITYKRKTARYLLKLPKNIRTRINTEINVLAETGEHNNAIKMQGVEGYRLRVGEYRVLYTKDSAELVIAVIKIGPRGDVYHD